MSDKYVITSAQACASVNNKVLNSILSYCKENNAELLILPMQGMRITEDKLSKKLYT